LVVDRDRDPLAGRGEQDPQRPAVPGHRYPLRQAAAFYPVDKPGDTGLIDAEQPG
jgi:hypothetical protein